MLKFRNLVTFLILCVAGLAGAHAEAELPYYFHARLQIDDRDKFFGEYVPEVHKHIKKGNGQVLYAGFEPAVQLEGTATKYWTVLIMFPTKRDFDRFYDSEGNQKVAIPIRYQAASINNISLFKGIAPIKVPHSKEAGE